MKNEKSQINYKLNSVKICVIVVITNKVFSFACYEVVLIDFFLSCEASRQI